jgi:molybdopterin biosynthesis enzyme
MLKAMLSANSLAVVPEGVASLPAGASVDVLILTEAGLSNSEPTGADEERE